MQHVTPTMNTISLPAAHLQEGGLPHGRWPQQEGAAPWADHSLEVVEDGQLCGGALVPGREGKREGDVEARKG